MEVVLGNEAFISLTTEELTASAGQEIVFDFPEANIIQITFTGTNISYANLAISYSGISGPNDVVSSNPSFLEYLEGSGHIWGTDISPGNTYTVELTFNITQLKIYGY